MRVSVLERLFVPERVPGRVSVRGGDLARPVIHERAVEVEDAPFVVTSMRKTFTPTRRRPDGTLWAGFADVSVSEEGLLTRELYDSLWRISTENAWSNRCRALGEATPRMQTLGFQPWSLTVPVTLLKEACGADLSVQDAEKLMLGQGYITRLGDLFVMAADLAEGQAILTAAPKVVGTYTRARDALALMVFRADRAVVLVGKAETEEPPQHGVA